MQPVHAFADMCIVALSLQTNLHRIFYVAGLSKSASEVASGSRNKISQIDFAQFMDHLRVDDLAWQHLLHGHQNRGVGHGVSYALCSCITRSPCSSVYTRRQATHGLNRPPGNSRISPL
jgi:hypothetical protein